MNDSISSKKKKVAKPTSVEAIKLSGVIIIESKIIVVIIVPKIPVNKSVP